MTGVGFDDLVPVQRQVADSVDRTVLVLGGAGTGKTTTALWAARRELTEGGTHERPRADHRVLFVTFSRTAVAQIRSRASGVLDGIGPSVEILTFHGLAFRLVRAFGSLLGFANEPSLVGEARGKLIGSSGREDALGYGDLLPNVLRLLETPGPVADLLRARWSLVICDEFQDTDDLEWRMLEALGEKARLLLLADPNQMIYQFKDGVSEARLEDARQRAGAAERTLPPGSHRDPTQVLPDAAIDIRWRRFDTDSVRRAVDEGRIVVRASVPDDDEERAALIASEIESLRLLGHESVGVYAKTNSDAAGLSAALTSVGVEHVPIGFNEAYGEALGAMIEMVSFASGGSEWSDVCTQFATFLTATVRSRQPPELALLLHRGAVLPDALASRFDALRVALDETGGDVFEAAERAVNSWSAIGILSGRRAWGRSAQTFQALVHRAQLDTGDVIGRLRRSVDAMRDSSFVELDAGDVGATQLMNFSQTKGREADAVILSYTSSDWYGPDAVEPFDEPSRILYVSITRARRSVVVLVPPDPHPLVAPFLSLT